MDVGVMAFAVLTLCTNAVVATGASLHVLSIVSLIALGALLPVAWWLRPRGPAPLLASVDTDGGWRDAVDPREVGAVVAVALCAAGAGLATGSVWPAWLGIVACAGWRLARSLTSRGTPPRPALHSARSAHSAHSPHAARVPWLVPALAALCALTVAVAHRANDDDAFYLNIAVAAVDAPDAPLLAGDTLHGYEGVPLDLPVFRVLAYEPGVAMLSRITGIDALVLAHVVLPPIFAALIPLAWARLLRRLAPAEWAWLLAGLVASLYLWTDGRATFGEFALLRLQQGKAILLVVLWPLLADAGIAFGRRPGGLRWLRLAAAQIAAVGLTSNALWLAPVLGGLGVCAGLLDRFSAMRGAPPAGAEVRSEPHVEGTAARDTGSLRPPHVTEALRTLAWGALASFHPVIVALILRAEMLRAFREAPHPLESLSFSATTFMAEALAIVAGRGIEAAWLVFAVIAALALAPTAAMRRFMAVFSGAAALLFWTPLWAHLVGTGITGPDTYFRVLWVWPLPLAFAVLLTAGIGWSARMGRRDAATRAFAFGAALVVGIVVSGGRLTISPSNGVRLGAPAVKIDPGELAVARALTRYAGPDEFVLAPAAPSRWIGLLQGHPHPLVVREMLLDALSGRFDERELTLRAQLTRMAGGDVRLPHSGRLLTRAIETVPLRAVALTGEARGYDDVLEALEASPLERVESNDAFEIWARPDRG